MRPTLSILDARSRPAPEFHAVTLPGRSEAYPSNHRTKDFTWALSVVFARRMKAGRCKAAGCKKPDTYSLPYTKDFLGLRTTQISTTGLPQLDGNTGTDS